MTEETSDAGQVLVPLLAVAGAVVLALLAAWLVKLLVRTLATKSVIAGDLARRARHPLRAVLVVIAVWIALRVSVPAATWRDSDWLGAVQHVLLIALIGTGTWLVGSLAFVIEDAALSRYRVDVRDNRHARRVRTQIQLLRRITVAALVVIAVAAVLLTFPGVSAFGASLLASAGVLSIVAGLAAQSSLANVFAGLQLAFTDAIRVDDVVIVEEEWGRIEEITLTYVVVHVWDDRRLILPSTYFTQTPFENWTRRAAELLGTVELDVDWQVPVDGMRAELNRLLADTDLWDRRVGILQVTDAVNGMVRLRALASAVDAPTLFDLRCYLREGLVAWLQAHAPEGLPRTRLETITRSTTPAPVTAPDPATAGMPQDARLFTGSVAAMERSRSFAGPGQDVIDEREEHAADVAERSGEQPAVEEAAAPTAPRRTAGSGQVPSFADTDRLVLPVPDAEQPVARLGVADPGETGTVAGPNAPGASQPSAEAPAVDDTAAPGPAPTPGATPPPAPPTEQLPPVRQEKKSWDDSSAPTPASTAADQGTAVLPAVPADPEPQPADQEPDTPPDPPRRRSIRSNPVDPGTGGR
ncbi:mechanosensitive ion channel family protein [Cellulomonas denverensis]|uniref:mechanosensitive ion channel family protein n=1 Tax=Cellulomonas denverensis TaxID=264297 RepID=UPI0027E4EBE3|nr:mechanosensitive ion channel domain-containing protein [Cellulomonas denverensis]